MATRIGLFPINNDSEALIETMCEHLTIAIPDVEFSVMYKISTIRGSRTLLVFDYNKENLMKVLNSLDTKLKNILAIHRFE